MKNRCIGCGLVITPNNTYGYLSLHNKRSCLEKALAAALEREGSLRFLLNRIMQDRCEHPRVTDETLDEVKSECHDSKPMKRLYWDYD